jgi:hypothetical protein
MTLNFWTIKSLKTEGRLFLSWEGFGVADCVPDVETPVAIFILLIGSGSGTFQLLVIKLCYIWTGIPFGVSDARDIE